MRIEASDLDAFQAELRSKDYKYARPGIEATPWGTRDMFVTDPFGNRLTFTEHLAPDVPISGALVGSRLLRIACASRGFDRSGCARVPFHGSSPPRSSSQTNTGGGACGYLVRRGTCRRRIDAPLGVA